MTDLALGIAFTADGSKFRQDVGLSRKEIDQLRRDAEGIGTAGGKAGRGMDTAAKAATKWQHTARAANENTKRLSQGYEDARRRADLLRVALLALATGAAARVVGSFIHAASETENLRVRLKFLTDDADAATKAIVGYAAQVPFAFEEIQQAAPILLTVAKDQAEFNKLLRITGDVAAASGLSFVDAAQQIQRSFAAGIGAADLFRERGVTAMLGFQAGVQTSAEETRKHILKLWSDSSFALVGSAAAMADTWTGLTSMLGDKWFQFQNLLMNAAPFDFLKAIVAELNDDLDKRFGSIGDAADSMGKTLVDEIETIAVGAASAVDTLTPIADAAVEVVNRLIDTFNNLPPIAQEVGVFGTLLFGRKFGAVFLGGMAAADQMDKWSKQLFDKMGVEQDSVLRDLFTGRQAQGSPLDHVPGPAQQSTEDFLARVRARMEALRRNAGKPGGAGGNAGAGAGAGTGGSGTASEFAMVRDSLAAEHDQLKRLAAAWQGYGASVKEAKIQNEIDQQLRKAKVSAMSDEGQQIARLVRENAAYDDAIDKGEAAKKNNADAIKEIRDKLKDTLPAYAAARQAAAQWRATTLADLDESKAGYDAFAADVERIYTHMLKDAYEQNLADSRRWEDGVTRGFRGYAKEATDAGKAAESGITKSLSSMEDALTQFVTTGKLQFGDLVDSMISDIARLVIRQQITGPIAKALGGVNFGDLFGGGSNPAGPGFSTHVEGRHGGGVIGRGGGMPRTVDPAVFMGAPRFHRGGLVGGEVPIVAKVGEEVLTSSNPRHRDNLGRGAGNGEITLRIVDGQGNQVPATQRRGPGGQLDVEVQLDQLVAKLGRKRGTATRSMLEDLGAGPSLRSV